MPSESLRARLPLRAFPFMAETNVPSMRLLEGMAPLRPLRMNVRTKKTGRKQLLPSCTTKMTTTRSSRSS